VPEALSDELTPCGRDYPVTRLLAQQATGAADIYPKSSVGRARVPSVTIVAYKNHNVTIASALRAKDPAPNLQRTGRQNNLATAGKLLDVMSS
jgi:hypothetical protein